MQSRSGLLLVRIADREAHLIGLLSGVLTISYIGNVVASKVRRRLKLVSAELYKVMQQFPTE
jgi:hypothetical protein